jgi:hypothetical protein
MSQNNGSQNWRKLRPTGEQEARIQAGIAEDPDNPELAPKQIWQMRLWREIQAERGDKGPKRLSVGNCRRPDKGRNAD